MGKLAHSYFLQTQISYFHRLDLIMCYPRESGKQKALLKELFIKQQKSVTTKVFEGSKEQLNKWLYSIISYLICVQLLIVETEIYENVFLRK